VIREGSRIVVVTAGLGTSHVPLRIGAPPDMWLIEMRGPAKGQLSK
jgi:predicted MPP superfamily phosphohydrolase